MISLYSVAANLVTQDRQQTADRPAAPSRQKTVYLFSSVDFRQETLQAVSLSVCPVSLCVCLFVMSSHGLTTCICLLEQLQRYHVIEMALQHT